MNSRHVVRAGVLPIHSIMAALVVSFVVSPAGAAEPLDFNRDVRPILSDKCFACHGPDAKHREADLRLDVPATDGGTASAIVPGQPGRSPLMMRVTSTDEDERMPPAKTGKKLSPGEIDMLRRWIAEGAKYERPWAYVSPRRREAPAVPPSLAAAAADGNWIDAFVLTRLAREGFGPAPEADRRTLARRLSFDLLGLPPTPERVEAFVADREPRAYERLVDELLASEHLGERLAVYWLDLVRYADTVGYHGDQEHHASPYRDYVIDAFNRDLPFDQFTREQLAGDLLPNPTPDHRIATCYNRLLQTSHEGGVQPKEYLTIYAADRVRNVSAVWFGATIGCAQCHDHKFDPYTMRDFYSLAAFFADVDEEKHLRGDGGDVTPTRRAPEIAVHSRRQRARLAELDARIAALGEPEAAAARDELATLTRERDALRKAERRVMVTQSLAEPRVVRVLARGSWLDESGPIVAPAVPEFLGRLPLERRATRLDLADWLVDAKSGAGGLTARVLANRLWYLLFGAGLSRSLEDFGGQGEPPSHPELLDALANDLVENGWSVKRLIKTIVLSRTYRQASGESPESRDRDPENRLLSRQTRWRLPAESIRDTALVVSGLLVTDVGGASARPYQPAGYYRHLNFPKREYKSDADRNQWRRGVYVHWQRQFLHPMLKAFDAPSREECTARRPRSNTPLAALVLLNDPTFVECARGLAQRTLAAPAASDEQRVTFAFRECTQRSPDSAELAALVEFLAQERPLWRENARGAEELVRIGQAPRPPGVEPAELAAWTSVGRVLLNLSETMERE